MTKVVVQEGLEEIRSELDKRGYHTYQGQGELSADAVVYSGVSCDWSGVPTITNDWVEGSDSPLLINAVGLTPQEAADLIASRLNN